MNTNHLFDPDHRSRAPLAFVICLTVLIAAVLMASLTQRSFWKVSVSNVTYTNFNGIFIRAKLLKPLNAASTQPAPGILYIHGYQNNREGGDAFCIELARRGMVVLEIDAIGRGNSGIPGESDRPDFDPSYGGERSLRYLVSLPYVDSGRIGLMGHSLGAKLLYAMALRDPAVKALVISGFAYRNDASTSMPQNMLMIFGKYDEFRKCMTATRDFENEWMQTTRTRNVFPVTHPKLGETYGDFESGTARQVYMPKITHLRQSHSSVAVAQALEWMRRALKPEKDEWIPSNQQIWQIKEWSTLVAMVACFASLGPLGLMLLRTSFFSSLQSQNPGNYACTGRMYIKVAALNGVLMWLYFPLIWVLFGVHTYLVRIDEAFPLMMTNGIIWWFLWINTIGFIFFRSWFKKRYRESDLTLYDLGLSYREERFALDGMKITKTVLLAAILFLFAYLIEHTLESVFLIDFRFVLPFASDLTGHRAKFWFTYFPFLLMGFLLMGIFLHGQLRRPQKATWFKTFISWSTFNTLILIIPLILLLLLQYLPLFTIGAFPLVGPGGMFITFTHNLFYIIGVLIMITPISTWLYQLTGKIYLGAILNAALVAWMFVSSQAIAPVRV